MYFQMCLTIKIMMDLQWRDVADCELSPSKDLHFCLETNLSDIIVIIISTTMTNWPSASIRTCSARVLLGKTEWAQFGAQECDMNEKVGKIAWDDDHDDDDYDDYNENDGDDDERMWHEQEDGKDRLQRPSSYDDVNSHYYDHIWWFQGGSSTCPPQLKQAKALTHNDDDNDDDDDDMTIWRYDDMMIEAPARLH